MFDYDTVYLFIYVGSLLWKMKAIAVQKTKLSNIQNKQLFDKTADLICKTWLLGARFRIDAITS